MEEELKRAVLECNTDLLREIHRNNPLLLARSNVDCFAVPPLHGAVLRGRVDFAGEILRLCPDLAGSLDPTQSSPLHLASATGNLEMVKLLVRVKPEMCNALNRQGLSPVHLAAANGWFEILRELEILGELVRAARTRTDQDETLLHHSIDDQEFAYTGFGKDQNNQTVSCHITTERVYINAKNTNGCTASALDVVSQSRRDVQESGTTKSPHINPASSNKENENNPQISSMLRHHDKFGNKREQLEWLSKTRDALMIVASLLASMAFQAGVNPPGGVWQEGSPPTNVTVTNPHRAGEAVVVSPPTNVTVTNPHRAGEAVVAFNYPETYKFYLRANTVSFVASLSTILLLISGLPMKQRAFVWILMGTMWISITSMAFTYSFSIIAVTPKSERRALRRTMYAAIPVWCAVMALLFLGHSLRLTKMWLKKKGIDMWEFVRRPSGWAKAQHANNENQNASIPMTNL